MAGIAALALSSGWIGSTSGHTDVQVRDIGSRLELLVDRYLIDRLDGATLRPSQPLNAGVAVRFDEPWEGPFAAYATVVKDGPRYRLYYRGLPRADQETSTGETTCYAESSDGITWTKPRLRLFEVMGTRENNVVLAKEAPFSSNFSPFLDARPDVPASERWKALAGSRVSGLVAFASPDGLHWRKLRREPVITAGAFDSQNVAFWSASEGRYVAYVRTFLQVGGHRMRWVSRAESADFLQWSEPVAMEIDGLPPEHLYTNQTHPYFRAPHLYIGLAARFMPGRRGLTDAQAKTLQVDARYLDDVSDGVLLTSRGGTRYDRALPDGFIRPEIGPENWTSRTNYPALNVVSTGEREMSFYVQAHYGQPTHHLRRYTLPTDRFASVHADGRGGELLTVPLTFTGTTLTINFATSAAGSLRVELQDVDGRAIPGFTLETAVEMIGNEIERTVSWTGGHDVRRLARTPIRLRIVMKDADLYALRFR